ncbi:hypothetical protein I6F65_20680 [Pseudoalteromonas sp. SWXJZ94C]|uniref:hypothetical protein n=1 Tax=Pseudoalteromonas sp. SWXJZ94C TaxID=2792065 RepID=UPI0018CF466A|nr:hypothetical protein [Pseudoalteromonas sp. SWXJZ94C]MBH0059362.1 hypothetical protein [Pseudoalteromonas sp. SWXJZ94C]
MNYLYVCILAIFSFNCGATSLVIKSSFSNKNGTYAFFDEQISLTQAKDFLSLETKIWSYEFDLESPSGEFEKVETCKVLTKKIEDGYQAFRYSEQKVANARRLTCEMWRVMSKLTSSDISYVSGFEHDLNLPK